MLYSGVAYFLALVGVADLGVEAREEVGLGAVREGAGLGAVGCVQI